MRKNKILRVAMVVAGLFLTNLAAAAFAQKAAAPQKEPDPLVVLQEACNYLKSLQQFSFRSEVTYQQVYYQGKKLEYGLDMDTFVKRPGRLMVKADGDIVNRRFFFNGKTITLYDENAKIYASMDVPPRIEAALKEANKKYGVRVALVDLASPKLWELVSKKIRHSLYVGMSMVRGVPCYHLAFDGKDRHLEVWIEAGNKPLIRKILIENIKQQASPEWTAYLGQWNTKARLADAMFNFVPPSGVKKVKFVAPAIQPPTKGKKTGGGS